MYNLWILWAMIYIPSWTTKKHKKNSFQATTFKAEKNSRTFQGHLLKFKDFWRLCEPCVGIIQCRLNPFWNISFGDRIRAQHQETTGNWVNNRRQNCWDCTQIGSFQRTKECTTLPPPLHTKLGCLLFSAGSSNSGTNIAWRGWGRKSFTVPLSLKSVTRQKASLG